LSKNERRAVDLGEDKGVRIKDQVSDLTTSREGVFASPGEKRRWTPNRRAKKLRRAVLEYRRKILPTSTKMRRGKPTLKKIQKKRKGYWCITCTIPDSFCPTREGRRGGILGWGKGLGPEVERLKGCFHDLKPQRVL